MNAPNFDLLSAFAAAKIGVGRSSSTTVVCKYVLYIMLYIDSTQAFQANFP